MRFWDTLRWRSPLSHLPFEPGALNPLSNLAVVAHGVPGFFAPNLAAAWGTHAPLGAEHAAYYDTSPLAETLRAHVDFDRIARGTSRLTVGAVNVESGRMRYFDSRHETLGVEHVMASGALPPAFPAVRVGKELYWDGGIYSNTPIEAVLDDNPRRDALIFAVQLWNPQGDAPDSIWQVMGRQKDIQYASRADSHIARQQQIHRLRHVIGELVQHLPPSQRDTADVRELAGWGCKTTMHIVRLLAPRLAAEDHTKDIDFTAAGIRARREAGLIDAREVHRAGAVAAAGAGARGRDRARPFVELFDGVMRVTRSRKNPKPPSRTKAHLARNVDQPDHILANPIMSHKAQRRPGSGEIGLAVTKHDGVQVDSILIDQAQFGEALRQLRASNFDLPVALGLQLADGALEIILNNPGVGADRLQRARDDPFRLLPPRRREGVFLCIPFRMIVVPVTHDLIHFSTVDTARLPLGLLDEVAEERGAWRKRHVVDVAVQGLVHSEHELGHAANLHLKFSE